MQGAPRRSGRAAVIAAALLLALGGAARAQDWSWAKDREIVRVVWKGLDRLNESEANSIVATQPDETFSSQTLAEDLARLYRSGRFRSSAGMPPVSVVVREHEGGVLVEFTVRERPTVRRVIFLGSDVLDTEDLEAVETRSGALFDAYTVEQDARTLRRTLRDEGYLYAEVTHREEERESGVDVTFTIRAGPEVNIEDIQFVGHEQLDPEDIWDLEGPDQVQTRERQLFGLLEDGHYDPETFARDLDRIARYYRSQGFLDARVYKLEERFDPAGGELTLVVAVEEGQRYRVRRVRIEGARVLSEERILREIALRPGRPFLGADLRDAIDRIKHLYGQRAYIHARVAPDIRYDDERNLLDVTLRVEEGPQVRVEEVRIEGNDKTREKVIRRELSVYPGDYFNADELQESLRRLGRLRYFNDVRIDFEEGSEPGREDLVIQVEEARTGSFVLGGGISTSAGFFGNISLTQRNFDLTDLPRSLTDFLTGRAFTGAGQELTISVQPGRERSQFSIEFTEPYLLGYPVPLSVLGSIRDRLREDWLEQRRNARVSLGYRFTQDLIFRTSYRIERVHIGDIELDAVPDVLEVAGTSYVSGLRFSLDYDKNAVDRYFVAYDGYGLSAYYEVVGDVLGGDYDFHRVGGEANVQHTFFSFPGDYKWVLALRGEVGWQRSFDGDPIPIFERFFAGGPNSIRGFEFRTVTPQLRDKPLGGDFLALGTAEFSFPVFQDILRGVLFADAGGVTEDYDDFDADDVRLTAGVGARIKVPVFPAPVALDFGWPILEKDADDPQVFSFSVGFGF